MKIYIKNLNKTYGKDKIFDNFNIEFDDEKVNCIVGESGCGKSTIANLLTRFHQFQYFTQSNVIKPYSRLLRRRKVQYMANQRGLGPTTTCSVRLSLFLVA